MTIVERRGEYIALTGLITGAVQRAVALHAAAGQLVTDLAPGGALQVADALRARHTDLALAE